MAKDAKRKNVFGLDATSIIPKQEVNETKEVVEGPVVAEKVPQDAPIEKVEETPVEVKTAPKTPRKTKKEPAEKKETDLMSIIMTKKEKEEIRSGRFQCKIRPSYLKKFDDLCKKTGQSRADILEKLIDNF